MSRIKTVKSIASTLTIAVAVGFLVQYGESGVVSDSADDPGTLGTVPQTMMMAKNAVGQPVFGVPDVVTTPVDHAANVQRIVAVDAVYKEFAVPEMGTILAMPIPGCATTLMAQRKPAAMIDLVLSSPCKSNAIFFVEHEGLRFLGRTDDEGNAVVAAPALAAQANFSVTFGNVREAEANVFVPELRRYDRAVLQWQSGDNMQLHALEGGAQIGDAGHVWSASIHAPEDTRDGEHGFVMYFGTTEAEIPYQAEVYTFPTDQMNREGMVNLLIGISVTDQNCDREVDATTIQTNAGERLVRERIAVQMPSCDKVDEIVFLDDQFTDLTVASN